MKGTRLGLFPSRRYGWKNPLSLHQLITRTFHLSQIKEKLLEFIGDISKEDKIMKWRKGSQHQSGLKNVSHFPLIETDLGDIIPFSCTHVFIPFVGIHLHQVVCNFLPVQRDQQLFGGWEGFLSSRVLGGTRWAEHQKVVYNWVNGCSLSLWWTDPRGEALKASQIWWGNFLRRVLYP